MIEFTFVLICLIIGCAACIVCLLCKLQDVQVQLRAENEDNDNLRARLHRKIIELGDATDLLNRERANLIKLMKYPLVRVIAENIATGEARKK